MSARSWRRGARGGCSASLAHRGRRARRGMSTRAARSPPPCPHPPRAWPVAEPNPPVQPTRTCALLCCEMHVRRVQVRAADRGIMLVVRRGLTVHHPVPSRTRPFRVPAGSACSPACAFCARVAPRGERVRFTPSRAASLSPCRAPLLAGASTTQPSAPAGLLVPAHAEWPHALDRDDTNGYAVRSP
jgi:hypothetical protein